MAIQPYALTTSDVDIILRRKFKYAVMKIKNLGQRTKISVSLFGLIFAGVGIYFLVNSFAISVSCSNTLTPGSNVASAIASASSGSTICLQGGNYSGFRIAKEGTNKTSYVTIISVPGQTANFTGSLTFDNARYIRLENLKINGGINFTPAGSNIEVKGNEITGNVGIYMFGDYRTVAQGGSSSSCPCEVTNVNIENNNIHDIDYTGSQGPGGGVGITGVGDTHHVKIKNNTIKSVASDYIQSGMIHDWEVDSNIFLGPSLQFPNHPSDHQDLWQIFGCDTGCYDTNHLIYNIKFNNNVARSTGTAESLLFQTAYFRNVEIQNNLFDKDSRGTTIQIYNTDGLVYRYNTHIEEAESSLANQGALFRDGGGTAGANYQVDHNIFVKLRGSGTAIGTEGRAGTWGVYDYNVSNDSSAIGTGSIRNWTPNWVNTTAYQAVGLPIDAGYKPGRFATSSLTGDANGDGVVNIVDLSALLSHWGTNYSATDFNNDLTVNIIDLSMLLSNYGKTTPPPTDPVPLGVGGTWNLKFSDEFNGTSLDLNKWRPNWLAGNDTAITKPVNDAELSCYDPKQVAVSGGVLSISAVAKNCTANNGTTYSYASGLIESYDHYQFTYGYMEAKMNLPGTNTPVNWPAFWANGTGNWPTTGEIDVMEVLGGNSPVCWHFHYSGGAPGGCTNLSPPNTGWHTFGANWEPGKITYYYDGAQVGQVTSGVTSAPMYIIANMGLSNTYGGPVTTPAKLDVDYIRVWQH